MTDFTEDDVRRRGHPVWAEVDLGAIRDNVRVLRERAPRAELMGVVKGYAYGHGNPHSARAMVEAGATRLGVARIAEALHLRDAGIEVPIHVFTEPPADAIPALLDSGLTATVFTETFALLLSEQAAARGLRAAVQLKLDTGMHRVGLLADDVPDAIRALRDLPGLEIEGAWSHLAVADVPDHPFTRKQVELFENLTGRIEASGIQLRYRHIANSAATLSTPETHFDMVRCGVACYGLWPGSALEGSAPLRPALALRALVVMSKVVPAGDGLSYGLEYHLERSGNVITVGAGYADGYDRRLSGTADVLLHGRRHRVSGVVCMDQFLVDVGDRASDVGDVVTLLGADGDENISAEELAAHIGTINYEVTTRIPSRVPRVYLEGES